MARYTGPITKKSRRLKTDLVGGDKNFDLRPFPPGQHDLMISVGHHRINGLRRARFEEARARGYRMASFVSRRARPVVSTTP